MASRIAYTLALVAIFSACQKKEPPKPVAPNIPAVNDIRLLYTMPVHSYFGSYSLWWIQEKVGYSYPNPMTSDSGYSFITIDRINTDSVFIYSTDFGDGHRKFSTVVKQNDSETYTVSSKFGDGIDRYHFLLQGDSVIGSFFQSDPTCGGFQYDGHYSGKKTN